jgi:hypothetical protein
MTIELEYQQQIIHILTDIFPGVLIYYSNNEVSEQEMDGKQPDVHIALDLGGIIGHKDLRAAEIALAETDIPYSIHLHDLQAVAQQKFEQTTSKQKPWKL